MKYVIAIGGNALLKRGEALEAPNLKHNAAACAASLAPLLNRHQAVIVHGNGPQVGLLALQAENYHAVQAYPFDILVAESQGMIGYLLQQNIANYCDKPVVSLLTQIAVDKDDPAFANPSKPIGPVYDREEVAKLNQPTWQFKQDGDKLRRVVASPKPLAIIELQSICDLMTRDHISIAAGGGGVAVATDQAGHRQGLEAVIDKDLSAALLAEQIDADALIILTDVDAVYENWGSPEQRAIKEILAHDLAKQSFAAGSMGPKVLAACAFVSKTGRPCYIGQLTAVEEMLAGEAGTKVIC